MREYNMMGMEERENEGREKEGAYGKEGEKKEIMEEGIERQWEWDGREGRWFEYVR